MGLRPKPIHFQSRQRGVNHFHGHVHDGLATSLWHDNVEDEFGHLKFFAFYLLCGIAATFAQFYFSMRSSVPNVGASGAIAGVLGAYIVMFPAAKVNVLVARQVVALPAVAVLGFWIVLQLFSGVGSIAQTADTGGVAYMAHIGGFAAGLLMSFLFRGRRGSSHSDVPSQGRDHGRGIPETHYVADLLIDARC